MEDEKGSIEDFIFADAQFHQSIIRAANNEILESMEGVIFSALLSSIRITNKDPRDNSDSIPFHSEVTNAIVTRNPELAEENMKKLAKRENVVAKISGLGMFDPNWTIDSSG